MNLNGMNTYFPQNIYRILRKVIFKTYHNRKDIYDLKDEHTLDFWQSYFETKVPKEKFDVLCTTNNISELEASLTSDLLYFINNCTYDIGETFLIH